jgi:hypothetical protein
LETEDLETKDLESFRDARPQSTLTWAVAL